MFPTDEYKIREQSLEYLPVKVIATKSGNPYDPTGTTVQIAVTDLNEDPVLADWKPAQWQTVGGDEYFARILVGPAGDFVPPAKGDYDIFVKVFDDPEVPVMRAGRLVIF